MKHKKHDLLVRGIECLGTGGTQTPEKGTISLRVSKHCVIDAGNLIRGMGRDVFEIEHLFLTHSHFDHIVDIPSLTELFVTQKKTTLKIYALPETLSDLKELIFNFRIWPNFQEIDLVQNMQKTVEFIEIVPERIYPIDDITLMPFKTNHTNGSCGYVVNHRDNAIMITADTYQCDRIWEIIDAYPSIHSLIIDVSFPSDQENLACDSKHLTPALLASERFKSKRKDFAIYPFHLKAQFEAKIREEFKTIPIQGMVLAPLEDFTILPFDREIASYKKDRAYSFSSQLLMIGTALASESNMDSLLELIIKQSKLLTRSDGGILYVFNEAAQELECRMIQNDSLNITMGGRSDPIGYPPLSLYDGSGRPNRQAVATVCALDGYIINLADVYESKAYDFNGTEHFDRVRGYRSKSMLAVPLKDHEENLIGVLQLVNKTNDFGEIVTFDFEDEELALSIASQAAVALSKQKRMYEFETFLESLLYAINRAIEAKLPYCAGHIDRKVDLSVMLAKAISDDRESFSDTFYTRDELQEIKFSALIDDIGKIVTSEHAPMIDSHVEMSLKILQSLSFPKKFSRIPEIVSAHHKKITSKGSLFGLKENTCTLEGRILAIADIFAGLSASDGHSTKEKKLSEMMNILSARVKDEEIDQEIVCFMYRSGIYLEFAHKYLKPENIDEVEWNERCF